MAELPLKAPSFVRGGRRKLYEIDAGLGDPTEIWASETGELFTRCGGELVAGPIAPRSALLIARGIAAGGTPSVNGANMMALLLLAWAAQEGGQ